MQNKWTKNLMESIKSEVTIPNINIPLPGITKAVEIPLKEFSAAGGIIKSGVLTKKGRTFILTIVKGKDIQGSKLDGTSIKLHENYIDYVFLNSANKKHRDDGPAEVMEDFTGPSISHSWYVNGKQHRDNDLPAYVSVNPSGDKMEIWWTKGQRHRGDDKPAIVQSDGSKEWWFKGKQHRDNGLPSNMDADGFRAYFVKGKLHRLDGPAKSWPNGKKEWYIDDKKLTKAKYLSNPKVDRKNVTEQ